jgi:hypothetical protein
MSESTLSVGVVELRQEVGRFLGYGSVAINWSVSQLAEITRYVNSGVRRVYYPPAVQVGGQVVEAGYEWSWLRPVKTLSIVAADGDYDLPDDFGRLIGVINFAAASYLDPISIISVSKLLSMRAESDLSGTPKVAAIRYKTSTGSTGQRQEVLFYPEPDAALTLSYEYEAYSGALSDYYPYPLGGMQLAELYIESCLAVAESRVNEEIGNHSSQFNSLIVDAIARDRKRGARTFGQMGQPQGPGDVDFRRGYTGTIYPMTYNGDSI